MSKRSPRWIRSESKRNFISRRPGASSLLKFLLLAESEFIILVPPRLLVVVVISFGRGCLGPLMVSLLRNMTPSFHITLVYFFLDVIKLPQVSLT